MWLWCFLACVLVFNLCFWIAETGLLHVGSIVCFACLLCLCHHVLALKSCTFFLPQQQSPDTIPGPSGGPTVHKVWTRNTHARTHGDDAKWQRVCFASVVMSNHGHLHKQSCTCSKTVIKACAHFHLHPYGIGNIPWVLKIFQNHSGKISG